MNSYARTYALNRNFTRMISTKTARRHLNVLHRNQFHTAVFEQILKHVAFNLQLQGVPSNVARQQANRPCRRGCFGDGIEVPCDLLVGVSCDHVLSTYACGRKPTAEKFSYALRIVGDTLAL